MRWAEKLDDNMVEQQKVRNRLVMAKFILCEEFNLVGVEIASWQPVIWCGFRDMTGYMAKIEPSGAEVLSASWPPKTRASPDESRHRRKNLPDLCHLPQNVAGRASSPRLPSHRPDFDSWQGWFA